MRTLALLFYATASYLLGLAAGYAARLNTGLYFDTYAAFSSAVVTGAAIGLVFLIAACVSFIVDVGHFADRRGLATCPWCLERISRRVRKCPYCTTQLAP